jgi:mRNA-degrading endonuclease toxin of MazEF toxin-antitoxin module
MKMPSGTKYRQGDVVLAPDTFTDLSNAKPRPGLIISNSRLNNSPHDNSDKHAYWLMPISASQIDQPGVIELSPQDRKMVRCDKPCVIKPWKVFTLAEPLIRKKLGHISSGSIEAAIDVIHKFTEYDTGRL